MLRQIKQTKTGGAEELHDKLQSHPPLHCSSYVYYHRLGWWTDTWQQSSKRRLIMLHSIHQERQYNENYWKAWPLQGQCSLGNHRRQNANKEARKANTTDLWWSAINSKTWKSDIYTKIKQENGAKTLHVGIIFMGVLISQVCIYQIHTSLFGRKQLTSWSCFETNMQEKITTERYVIKSLKGCNISDILEQP